MDDLYSNVLKDLKDKLKVANDKKAASEVIFRVSIIEVERLINTISNIEIMFGKEQPINSVAVKVEYRELTFSKKILTIFENEKEVTIPQIVSYLLAKGEVDSNPKISLRKKVTDYTGIMTKRGELGVKGKKGNNKIYIKK